MDDPSFFEVDLDEEKAKRSILVTDVPKNITPKDVVIHFQRESNGGGEVENLNDHGSEHRSSVVITFEHPSIVESAIKLQQIIQDRKVTVQRFPVETKITEIFSQVSARINPRVIHDGSTPSLQQVLHSLRHDFGIEHSKKEYGYVIYGSYRQITLCRKHILDEIRNCNSSQRMPPGSAHNDMKIEALSPEEMGATSRSTATSDDEKIIDVMIFQSAPIILEFITTVPKYAGRIKDIESEFNVLIGGVDGGLKVVIRPLPGCTRKQHDDACEEYIQLYREVYDGPMMSKDIFLRPGNDSLYSAKDAVKLVLQEEPVVIQKMDEQDKWLFYGEEKNVKSAVREVCKKLKIDNPFRKTRKAKVIERRVTEEENDNSSPYSHMPLDKDEHALQENPMNIPNPIHKESPVDKEQRFVIKLKSGFQLTVHEGDITRQRVDVIVNFTDEYLSFRNGLPAALVRTGGGTIQKEAEKKWKIKKVRRPGNVIKTGGGRLYCSKILHIVTKKNLTSKKHQEESKNNVKESCLNCLRATQREKLKSIAFPAVGSGPQGIALDICVKAMINAVEEYMRDNDAKTGAVVDIRFVHLDTSAVEIFKAELKKRYGDSIDKPFGRKDDARHRKHETSAFPSHVGDDGSSSVAHKKTEKKEEEDVCPICLDGFHDPVTMSKCKHKFCRKCIDQAFQHRNVCPTCGMAYGVQTGNMPRGTMNHYFDQYLHLPGYERYGTIRIDYYFPSGTQGPEHPNPGQWYTGTSRTAFIPDCPEGREVLDLLKKAFDARLTFTIGRSVTTGASNVVTWNDIHHKTSPHGGATAFGYPDPGYLKRVKDELAAKGII